MQGTHIGLAIWRLMCFYETFVQGATAVILLNFCAKNPPHRQAENRWWQVYRTHDQNETTRKMNINKIEILNKICYTELVYERINKKLNSNYQKPVIETMLFDIIKETQEIHFQKVGKNFYISNVEHNIKITINSNTYRIITVDRITKNEK